MHIFRAFSEEMHNNNLEEFVKTHTQASPLSKGPAAMVLNEDEKERR
jgi:hypothetical protein